MKLAKISLAVLILFSISLPSRSVHADVAPPSQPSGSNVVPGEVTMVQMVYEWVVIDLRPPWSDGIDADVTARFVMRNQGTVDEQMSVGFPLNNARNIPEDLGPAPKLTDFVAKIDGVIVTSQYTSEDKWLNNKDQDVNAIDWVVFNVTFPVGKDVIIELNYKQPPTYDAPTTQYDYTLFTGAGWYGPIGAGDIVFRLPYTISYWENYWNFGDENAWAGANSEIIVENEARWHFEDFEPENFFHDNWTIHAVRPKDWKLVLNARQALIDHQYDAGLWKELGDAYSNSAIQLGKVPGYSYEAITAYEQSVVLKPDWAEAHASLAWGYYRAYRATGFYASEENPPDKNLQQGAIHELSIALALEPTNKTALDLREEMPAELPLLTPFTTPFIKSTSTPTPTVTPVVVTVVHTQIVNSAPMATSMPTQAAAQDENQKGIGAPAMIFGALVLFIAGIGAGTFWSKRMGK